MLQTQPNAPLFPAEIIRAVDGMAQLRWYSGNQYGRNQKPKPFPEFQLSVQGCVRAMEDSNLELHYGKLKVGLLTVLEVDK